MEKDIRILLVDDERNVRRSMEKTLLRAGFDVDVAEDISAGLGLFKEVYTQEPEERFDIAVLDLSMPNFEGVQDPEAGLKLLSKLLEIDNSLPTIVLTAYDDVTRAKKAVSLGARAYFVKGREAGLIELVNDILGL
ncbi:MAG: response regulator [Anaerolineae bacterium]|nr:response regulator [Anaerolineae bacterium]